MTMFLRYDGTNDHVTIPTIGDIGTAWSIRFKITIKSSGDISIVGRSTDGRRIRLRTALGTISIVGTTGTAYSIPCAVSLNETCTIEVISTVGPDRLTVYKNGTQTGQLTYTTGMDDLTWIGRTAFNTYGAFDLYWIEIIGTGENRLYSADGVTSGTVLPELNNSFNNGTLVNFTGNPWINDELFTLPTTITPLSSFTSVAISPYVDGAAVINFAGLDVNVTIAGGEFTTQMPWMLDVTVNPVLPLNGAITLTQGGNTSTIYRPIVLASGYDRLRVDDDPSGAYANFANLETTDDKYIAYHITLTTDDTWYFPTLNGYFVDQDSGVSSNEFLPDGVTPALPRTDVGIQQNTTTGMVTRHNVTMTPDGGIIVDSGGLSVSGLSETGLSVVGLSVTGL